MWWDCHSQNVQCHSQAVGHRKRCDETAFNNMCNITYFLLVIGKDRLSQGVQCHSLPIGHRKRCEETAFHKMCNVTHFLLVIGKDLMRLPFTKCAICHSPTVGHRKRCGDCLSQNMQCHSQTVGHSKRCDETAFHKMCNTYVTHWLLIIAKDVMRLPFPKCAICHSHPVYDRKDCLYKTCNVTHILLVIAKDVMRLPFTKCAMSLTRCRSYVWKDVMRLPFTKCAMSLTSCWSYEKMWWDCLSPNIQCNSLAVGHRKRCNETPFHKCAMSLTCCW